ncbi:hypothetical protein OIU74_005683 [Salix koriyanagi]|uniref:Uncharacterized protein n=1 Tax=Salix koriyanagi TaxID=2511006 RepID=A0A9Q0ZGQ3_9ROSI|nr:hypothetical protein OIU74_005683 [Salix koriyanagi]
MRRGQKRVFFLLLAIALCLCIANVDADNTAATGKVEVASLPAGHYMQICGGVRGEVLAYFKSRGLDVLDLGTLLGAFNGENTLSLHFWTDCTLSSTTLWKAMTPSMNKAFAYQMKSNVPKEPKKGQSDPLVFLTRI